MVPREGAWEPFLQLQMYPDTLMALCKIYAEYYSHKNQKSSSGFFQLGKTDNNVGLS